MPAPFSSGRLGVDFVRLWTANAVSDRVDRRRLPVAVNLARGVLLGGLALAVVDDAATVPVLYAAFFLFGTGETLADSTSVALLPSIVPAEALTRAPWVAGATLVLFGAHATVWGVVSVSLRQRIVPERLRGRVNSVYFLFDLGGAALGTILGGLLASAAGITAPFSLGSVAVALLALVTWRRLALAAI